MKKLLCALAVVGACFAASAEKFTLGEGDDAVTYDLSVLAENDGVKGAKDYVDAYADNVQNDKEFKAHEAAALATIRTEDRFFGSWWAILPPLIAAGVFYYIFNYLVAFAMERLENRYRYYN